MIIVRWVLIVTGGIVWGCGLLAGAVIAYAWITDPDPDYDWDAAHRDAERRPRDR